MDTPENLSPLNPQPDPEREDLREEVDALRRLITVLLLLSIVVSGTLTMFLLRQYRSTSRDLAAMSTQQAKAESAQFTRMDNFMRGELIPKLVEYGRAHPDFTPILTKYGISPSVSSNPPVTGPASKK